MFEPLEGYSQSKFCEFEWSTTWRISVRAENSTWGCRDVNSSWGCWLYEKLPPSYILSYGDSGEQIYHKKQREALARCYKVELIISNHISEYYINILVAPTNNYIQITICGKSRHVVWKITLNVAHFAIVKMQPLSVSNTFSCRWCSLQHRYVWSLEVILEIKVHKAKQNISLIACLSI